jgi:hypothetical protein
VFDLVDHALDFCRCMPTHGAAAMDLLQRVIARGSDFSLHDTYRQRAFFNALWSTD